MDFRGEPERSVLALRERGNRVYDAHPEANVKLHSRPETIVQASFFPFVSGANHTKTMPTT
jgi:hypothetical protein